MLILILRLTGKTYFFRQAIAYKILKHISSSVSRLIQDRVVVWKGGWDISPKRAVWFLVV